MLLLLLLLGLLVERGHRDRGARAERHAQRRARCVAHVASSIENSPPGNIGSPLRISTAASSDAVATPWCTPRNGLTSS